MWTGQYLAGAQDLIADASPAAAQGDACRQILAP
jgi:hypothetical protein